MCSELSPGYSLLIDVFVVVSLAVIALIIVVVVRLKADVIKHHAEDLRSHILQQLPRTFYDMARALSTVDYQQHSVDHRGNQHPISERANGRRIDPHVTKL